MANDAWWMSPSTCAVDSRATIFPRMSPTILPSTITRSPATFSRDFAALADDHLRPGHITLKLAINLDLILADDLHALACNSQIIFDHHFPAPIMHNAILLWEQNISAHDQGNQSSKPAPFTTLIVENLWKSLGFDFGEARPRLWITRALNSHESTHRILDRSVQERAV